MAKRKDFRKHDRVARLLKVWHLLNQTPRGLSINNIAKFCEVSSKTTRRDLAALESELGLPIWEDNAIYGIVEGYVLPPIQFSLPEALNIFLASRLMLRYSNKYDPNTVSLFLKLNSVMKPPLQDEIQKTLDWMGTLPKDQNLFTVLSTVAKGWIEGRCVEITYQGIGKGKPGKRVIEPYFIEPAAAGHASYVVGHCQKTNSLRTFKIERIQSAMLLKDCYTSPTDFNANQYFSNAMGIMADENSIKVKLKFFDEIAEIVQETVWHPSQAFEAQDDGSVVMTLQVSDTWDLFRWVLGWGDKVMVVEPTEFKARVRIAAEITLAHYQEG
jgi:predicted DNA-binding transcriptional regulator YafY